MTAEEAVRAWVDAWTRAWPAKDPAPVAERFAPESAFRSQPFRKAHVGPPGVAEYARWAFEEQEDVRFWFGQPVVAGSRAAVEYWAVVTTRTGETTIAGSAFLRFDTEGLVVEQRDYWSELEGGRAPPSGWGS
jgi:hypothetical protein